MVMASAAAQAYQIADVVRLRAVELWSIVTDGSINTIDLEYVWSANEVLGNSVIHSDTSLGTSQPAHIYAKPPRHSLASFTQSTSNADIAFKMNLPAGAIIDVHLTYSLRDSAGVQAVTGAIAGATAGTMYIRALNSSVSTSTLPPISVLSL